jgi:hypothetical protein
MVFISALLLIPDYVLDSVPQMIVSGNTISAETVKAAKSAAF